MPKSYHLTACFVSSVFLLIACRSDADKLQRLEGDQSTACLVAEMDKKEYETARFPGGMTRENIRIPATPAAESLGRKWYNQKTKCDLATRDLNRFMRE